MFIQKQWKKHHMSWQRFLRLSLSFLLIFGSLLLAFLARWAFTTWSRLTMEEIIYELSSPLEGTGSNIIQSVFYFVLFPAVAAAILIVICLYRIHNHRSVRAILFRINIVAGLILIATVFVAYVKLDFGTWLENRNRSSNFIAEHYADPHKTKLTFPEKKRNLIYLYLESMETTYSDEKDGGGFEENVIPELTKLAQENVNFSGKSKKLNGGYAMYGATWTMGGMFAQTSGLPLKIDIGNNGMQNQLDFFPSIETLGDILEDEGYNQMFLLGSDASFGGRRLYYTQHGHYAIRDYNYAVWNDWIPRDYRVWWGYEDHKLFGFARQQLTELAKKKQPFNFTMLTVDTHFPDGYVCEYCPHTFGSNQYANVMACSSKQVTDFVKWVQQQDFYKDTTIIINGDHLTMDGDFCDDVSPEYMRRTYTCVIHPDAEVQNPEKKRTYTTFDMFPTTLAALGVKIDGNHLGLGTNLFSGKKTLAEKYGIVNMNIELARKSPFMEEASGISQQAAEVSEALAKCKPKMKTWKDSERVNFYIKPPDEVEDKISNLYVAIYNKEGARLMLRGAIKEEDGSWTFWVRKDFLGSGRYTWRVKTDSIAGDLYIGKKKSFTIF